MRMKEESEKAGLKLSIQETKIIAPSPITSWRIDGEKAETVTDFIFLVSKMTMDRDCSHEIKRHLFLERKAMTNPDRVIKKQRHCFVDKGPYVKVMVVMSDFAIPWTAAHQAPPSMGFSKQEYRSVVSLPSPIWC